MPIIQKLMLTDFIFPEAREEGEWYNFNWAAKHQLLVNTNTLQHQPLVATTSTRAWQEKKVTL